MQSFPHSPIKVWSYPDITAKSAAVRLLSPLSLSNLKRPISIATSMQTFSSVFYRSCRFHVSIERHLEMEQDGWARWAERTWNPCSTKAISGGWISLCIFFSAAWIFVLEDMSLGSYALIASCISVANWVRSALTSLAISAIHIYLFLLLLFDEFCDVSLR